MKKLIALIALLSCTSAYASIKVAGTGGGGVSSWNDLSDIPAGFADDTDDTVEGGWVATAESSLNMTNFGLLNVASMTFSGNPPVIATTHSVITAHVTDTTTPDIVIGASSVTVQGLYVSGGGEFATALEIPNSDDPDVDAVGEISLDTDGWLRAFNGTVQYAVRFQEEFSVTVSTPNGLPDANRDAVYFYTNKSGMSFVVTGWDAVSDTDDTSLAIEEVDADGGNAATVDAVEIATNGTGFYYGSDTTITAATVENGHRLRLDFDDTDVPGLVNITIYGYYSADVN